MTHTTPARERITPRAFDSLADLALVRTLTIEAFQPDRWDHNWEIRHWEGTFYHQNEATCRAEKMPLIRLWQTDSGRLVAAAHPEGSKGIVYIDLLPEYRWLEDAIFDWAEEALPVTLDDGRQRLRTVVIDYDTERADRIARRGYVQTPVYGFNRRRWLDAPIPEVPIAGGYTLRSMRLGDRADHTRYTDAIRAVFGHSFFTVDMVARFEDSPSYRPELQLVAEAPDGSFAAFCGLTVMPELALGITEPVGTHPDHVRRGLQRTLMNEGLRRIQALGATMAIVGTGDMIPANRLYEALGFTDAHTDWLWEKVW